MDWSGVHTAGDKALEGICSCGRLESVVDSLKARGLLMDLVDSCLGKRQVCVGLASMCVYTQEFCNGGCFSPVFLQGVSDLGGKCRGGCDDDCFVRVNGAVEVLVGDAEPEVACACNVEVDFGVFADALELNIVNIEFERNVVVYGAVGAEGVEAVKGDEEHGKDAACSYATVRLGGWTDHAVVLDSACTPIALDSESEGVGMGTWWA